MLVAFGWTMVPQVYAAIMLGTLVLFWLFSHSDPAAPGASANVKFTDQLKALKDPKVLKYCQYYSIVFGGYVALARCGWCSTTWVNTGWTSAAACWPPASPARRRAARHRWRAVRQIRRPQGHPGG